MLQDKLKNHRLILASGSPRRKQLLQEMGLEFEVRLKSVDEVYPDTLRGYAISDYLAELKASAFKNDLTSRAILITSDTVVWHDGRSLAKPADAGEAIAMLKTLSDSWHEVITSVCFTTPDLQKTVNHTTRVKFKNLTDEEIRYYVNNLRPFDKAGAYGIQEWIGLIAIERIEGSYHNVVGLPTQLVYETLHSLLE